ncbi:uncharacterized protein [Aegilops tauschii subsp. strangulata]|uniref:uncharacterized protein n=1 Tax=Aegilops tauschii subsp. strangulata TaxID=200361 RepID=UPI00098AFD09|nr:uncharacterized protein LOC109786415 [Aegilops tauschii subsp. strangulata]
MVAAKISNEPTFCIKKMILEHTCPTQSEKTRISSKWLGNKMLETIRSDPNTTVPAIVDKVKRQFGVEVPKMMAWRAKRKAKEIVLGDHKRQYKRLGDYLEIVKATNPGSRCIVATMSGKTRENPTAGPRPFIGLDGRFIKLTSGAQILAATGRDANKNMYPIAFGVVGVEDTPNWSWFLTQLKYALGGTEEGKFGKYTFMSDRQKGLLNAVTSIFPNCPHRYCLRHIYANFQRAGFRGEDLKKCMDAAAYAYIEHDFQLAMESMKAECKPAWEWMSRIPPKAWSRHAMDTNCKTDLAVNNLSEVFNKYIVDVRNKPIVTMINGIKDKFLVRCQQKREGGLVSRWEIAPTYAEKLEMNKRYARDCKSLIAGPGLFQVSSGDKTYSVDTNLQTCGCKKWDLSGIPCNHACSAIYRSKQLPEDHVNVFFKKAMYLESYKPIIYPVPGPDCWVKTATPDIDPPQFKEDKKGPAEEKRKKGRFEPPQAKQTSRMATITCSNCKLQGHKYTSCAKPLRQDLQIRKNKHMENKTAPAWQQGGSSTSATTTPRGASSTSASRGSSAAASRGNSARAVAPSARAAGTYARAANSSSSGAGTAAARRGAKTCARSFNPPRTIAEPSTSQPIGHRSKRTRYMSKRMEGYFYASGNY